MNINEHFKLPIFYNDKKVELKQTIIADLELIQTIDESCNPIYSHCFNTDSSCELMSQFASYYTTDVAFLKDNQTLLKEYTNNVNTVNNINNNLSSISNLWNELRVDNGFREKYCYVDWNELEFLNKSSLFLLCISSYNLLSPIISLLVPVLILIIPFLILKTKGIDITIAEYCTTLKVVAQTNAIGKLFTVNFSELGSNELVYIIVSALFYVFSIYQNVMICIKFINNMKIIQNHFREISEYLNSTLESMNTYLLHATKLVSHEKFNNILKDKITILENINNNIKSISIDVPFYIIPKITELGNILKYFYELHTNMEYNEAIMYSLGFNKYIGCIQGLQQNIINKKMNFVTFIKKETNDKETNNKETNNKGIFKNSYYACLKDESPVKNTIKFNKTRIITGPNASGKTTILKSTLINIIFSQQFGCGFYSSKSKFTPFKYIHCYLNIPDTSGRDSLFQAEARRCKEILDTIKDTENDESHFCAFDELYSGTNPDEAETSAIAFMKYLQKFKNVKSILTTHFIKVCTSLDSLDGIQNDKMVTEKKGSKIKYTYKLVHGISTIKGGIDILTNMGYPMEIISNI